MLLNSDSAAYGGGDQGSGDVEARPVPLHGKTHTITLSLPPLGVLFLKRDAPVEEPMAKVAATEEESLQADDPDELPYE